jgi:cation-transporting P-type ATPase C
MFFKFKRKPLLACHVVHSIPGRIRIGCRALQFLGEQKEEIENRLANDFAVSTATLTSVTENVVIEFDPTKTSAKAILENTENIIGQFSTVAYKRDKEKQSELTVQERRIQEEPINEMLMRLGINALTLLVNFVRKPAPPSTFFQKFTNMNALTALSLSKPIFQSGFNAMRHHRRPNADTLSAAAILASLVSGKSGSSLTIILLADIAELLTAYTMERTRSAIKDMLSIEDQSAWKVMENGKEVRVPLSEIAPDDLVAVHTGDKVPIDGTVTGGEASVDQASLTGEFMPAVKSKQDKIYAGSTVKTGNLVIRADRVGDDRAISRIVHMVEEAQSRKAPVQAYADRFSAQFIPVNFLLSFIVYLITRSPVRALNMLIIDYSCGVRLSTATAFAAAICRAASQGVLVKGGNFIEMLNDSDTLILDKTGTITEGKPKIVSIHPASGNHTGAKEIVQCAAACEETANHPIALAILQQAREMGWEIPDHSRINVVLGKGVETTVKRQKIRVGSESFMVDSNIPVTVPAQTIQNMTQNGENVVYVSKGKKMLGVIGIHDSLREDMKKTLNRLRRQGYDDIILLTGDVEEHANVVASKMTVDSYQAQVLPEDKAEMVLRKQARGNSVVMVGDGVNDAPALAYADVGISLGRGSTEISIETADVAINSNNPLFLPGIIGLSQKTMEIIRQNFATAIVVNSVGLILASMGVLPVFWAAVLHNATTIAVVLNSGRILITDISKDI